MANGNLPATKSDLWNATFYIMFCIATTRAMILDEARNGKFSLLSVLMLIVAIAFGLRVAYLALYKYKGGG
jgi:hypothetical protein